ncbi:MAG TPA: S-methyl-5-thioribose-1-phosphate isomerase [Acidiferrobacteraceae bacterium]|nr:S-methyl-5-thioribose-1-phosphate isomerase [Acidiferrobacteraceae bacterium]
MGPVNTRHHQKSIASVLAQETIQPIRWQYDGLKLLDQRVLPERVVYLNIDDVYATAAAITDMVVRGAPAIGITAAYGVVLAARQRYQEDPTTWRDNIKPDLRHLKYARPTAINLAWAVDHISRLIDTLTNIDPVPQLLAVAQRIHADDIAANRRMGELGAALIGPSSAVLTHCNAGALATGGYGTALGVIRAGVTQGRIAQVYADETRPWLQGSRLTAWELAQDNIPVSLIADGAAAWLMKQGQIQWVIVGSDRIAANGDVANKIGTYSTAVSAHHHGVRFMVVAPSTTVDMETASGDGIPIETRAEDELLCIGGKRVAPAQVSAWNPVFDITPAELIDVIVTEKGVVERPDRNGITRMMDA